nr:hypothetical protein [Tanacetum cinerariifolium]
MAVCEMDWVQTPTGIVPEFDLKRECSELGNELTSLASSELGSELTSLAGSELGLASYKLIEDYFLATCEPELCPFNFLLASCQVSSSELQGKENGVNILKSIDKGPYQMGTLKETLTEGTEVKLNKGLRDSNYDQLYAYLKQHEAPTNENKMMLDRFTQHTVDPLALMSNKSDPHQEEIDVVAITDDVLPLSIENDDSDGEVDAVVDNFIQNSEHEYSENEDSDNPSVPLPPPEPPDNGFNFEIKILVVRNVIIKFECIDARVKFDVFNDENNVYLISCLIRCFIFSPQRVRIRFLIL